MATRRIPQRAIDNLPEAKRKIALDALLEGKSLRAVAKIVGVSHQAVHDYKRRVVLPAIKTAQQLQSFQSLDRPDSVKAVHHTALTRDIVQASPFQERLEKLWLRADRSLDKAENAVRTRTIDGVEVWEEQGLQAIAPLLNQAHKNVELLGRVTGELEAPAAANIAIQIVMPSAVAPPTEANVQTIEIGLPKRR